MIDRVADIVFTEELYQIKRTALILSEPWEKVREADRILLDKILQAVRLTVNDVDVSYQPTLNVADLSTPPRRVIYFGKTVGDVPPLEVSSLNGLPVLVAPPLADLHNDPDSKKKLWAALQTLFSR